MRKFENQVQLIKYETLKIVAELCFEDKLEYMVHRIPKMVDVGPNPRYRCCIHHERAITTERVHLAMGGDFENPNIIEVLETACDKCLVNRYVVTETCRGCLAHRCKSSCPIDAIRIVGQKAVIDYDKCIECGRCKNTCPYNAIADVMRPCRRACPTKAIEINEFKKAVINNEKCIQCGACVYQCPFGAIQDKSEIVDVIKTIQRTEKEDIRLYVVIAPAFATQFNYAKLGQIVQGIKMLGFTDVIEAALGADIVSELETDEFVEHMEHSQYMTSSCCPAFKKFVENEHEHAIGNISKSVSPMTATAQLIKEIDNKAKVVFIGPCIAKKQEKRREELQGVTDYVLTFEELAALLDAKGIELDSLKEAPLNNASEFGRMFASTGGLTNSIKNIIEEKQLEIDFEPAICDGIDACDKALKMARVDRLNKNFIEGMACTGGCIKGPVTMHHGKLDKEALKTYSSLALEKTSESSLRIFDLEKINKLIE